MLVPKASSSENCFLFFCRHFRLGLYQKQRPSTATCDKQQFIVVCLYFSAFNLSYQRDLQATCIDTAVYRCVQNSRQRSGMGSGVSVVLVSCDKFCMAPRFEYFSTQTIVLIVNDMNQRSLSRSTIGAVKLNLKSFLHPITARQRRQSIAPIIMQSIRL